MKFFLAIVILAIGGASFSEAARPVSSQVVQKLKDIEPVYKDLQDRVVNAVAGAKLSAATRTDAFYQTVIGDKEASLAQAEQLEDQLNYQLDHQSALVETSCLGFIRSTLDSNMNVAGVGYTNCINTVEKGLKAEVDKIYEVLLVDESDIFGLSLLDVFNGENIIAGPAQIISKLEGKEKDIANISTGFLTEINAAVDGFSSRLNDLGAGYKSCLLTNESILKMAYENSKTQLTQICLGTIVP
ncbi:uncharacterized protein LOC131211283 [Anopheles bellator]|uniref:uncharacterized protein LOC131211283 n=1 Tax=Anopheles bellator TaxID=139047 RepID=UPI0026473AE4|nr:uncharacterized protein LOC131211283 [Anopheles bellator]